MIPRWLATLGPVALAACATPSLPTPPALAYGVPAPPVVRYAVGDTARVEIQAGAQSFAVSVSVAESWRMEFTPTAAGTRVTATLTDMDGRLTNPLTSPQSADESAVSGPVVFTLDRRGRPTVEALPTVTPAVAQFLSGSGMAHTFFPRLPGRTVGVGESWTDTVGYDTDESGARTSVRSVVTYTAAGDSVADGARYLLVRWTGTTEQSSAGSIGGTEFEQAVAGTTGGQFLWDAAAGILRSLEYASELSGTMAVPIAPAPLEVRVRSRIRVVRVDGP
ncbi:MAG: hypothetical protein EXR95_02275 [Gemmatimonadetes bacterium]|nr:hypothetical protein [Gemmatimonadota bacterium]